MMILRMHVENTSTVAAIDALIARHGSLRVALAFVVALLRGGTRKPRVKVETLSEHLRRDIGLAPSERGRTWWEIR